MAQYSIAQWLIVNDKWLVMSDQDDFQMEPLIYVSFFGM